MTVYAWPGFGVEDFELHLVGNGLQYPNPSSKDVQVVDQFGEYWAGSFSLPPGTNPDEGAERQAFFDKLMGGVHRVSMWDLKFPAPRGNARGTMTLGAAAAQLASSITLSGLTAAPNTLAGGSFEVDTDADGLADGWEQYVGGSTSSVAWLAGPNILASPRSQRISIGSVGSAPADRVGMRRLQRMPAPVAVGPVTASAYVLGNTGLTAYMVVDFLDASDAFIGTMSTTQVLTGPLVRMVLTGTPTVVPWSSYRIYLWVGATSGAFSGNAWFDDVQVELGSVATPFAGFSSLGTGSMLGVGGQLVRVMQGGYANDNGTITVPILPRLRTAMASGTAVQWDRPTANFLVMADEVVTRWRGGAQFEASRDIRIMEA